MKVIIDYTSGISSSMTGTRTKTYDEFPGQPVESVVQQLCDCRGGDARAAYCHRVPVVAVPPSMALVPQGRRRIRIGTASVRSVVVEAGCILSYDFIGCLLDFDLDVVLEHGPHQVHGVEE